MSGVTSDRIEDAITALEKTADALIVIGGMLDQLARIADALERIADTLGAILGTRIDDMIRGGR